MNIGIYIYEDAEVLDFSGPFEVFSVASRFLKDDKKFNVFLISEKENTVTARGNFRINPDYTFENHPKIDILIVVGGVHTNEVKKTNVIEWVKKQSQDSKIVASVCTGAFLLAEASLLNGLSVTTHWEDIDDLKLSYPKLTVLENKRWVSDGKYITSGGISAGIDMSLYLVSQLSSMKVAEDTAIQMEYNWHKKDEL